MDIQYFTLALSGYSQYTLRNVGWGVHLCGPFKNDIAKLHVVNIFHIHIHIHVFV